MIYSAMCDEQKKEQEAIAKVDQACALLLEAAPHLFNQGDGQGGWILHRIAKAFWRNGYDFMGEGVTIRREKDQRKSRASSEWKAIRLEIAARDGLVCHYCAATVKPSNFTVDHITPVIKGGTDDLSNLVACCRSCNSKNGVKDYSAFVGQAG
jgi:hypothetical protein